MKKLDLTKIGFFNPGRLSDEEVELGFIARIELFEFLLKKITENDRLSIPQHLLIIGQRGMGKTSLLVRLGVELKKEPYSKDFIPLNFPEEQYNLDRLSKLWLNSLDALADALDREGKTELTAKLDQEIGELSANMNVEAAVVYRVFQNWITEIGRTPVLFVDNLNLIFDKISEEEQHQLRAILMQKGAPILVGASVHTMLETTDYGAPFYDAFQSHYLKKLTLEESLYILKNLGELTGNLDFEQHLNQNRGRMAALYHLTGGTPRTLSMLFPLISQGFGEEIQYDLDALLDIITPLYKARFEELSTQMQVILDAIALNWDPASIEQIRQVTQLQNNQLSPQLKRLVDVGWLQKLSSSKTKGHLYEISERFFNIWYLMRRSTRRQKRELYCLSKFLESFYGDELTDIAKVRLNQLIENTNQASMNLALANVVNDEGVKYGLEGKAYSYLLAMIKKDPSILKDFDLSVDTLMPYLSRTLEELQELYDNQNWVLLVKKSEELTEIDIFKDLRSIAWHGIAIAKYQLKEFLNSENAYLQILKIDPNDNTVKEELIFLYLTHLNNRNKALELINSIKDNEEMKDSYELFDALVAFQNQNVGIGIKKIKKVFDKYDMSFYQTVEENWIRFAQIVCQLGYSNHLLQTLEETGHHITLRPYYVAIKALQEKDAEKYFNTIAAEVREPARKIFESMKDYLVD